MRIKKIITKPREDLKNNQIIRADILNRTQYSETPLYGHSPVNTDTRLLRTVLFVPTTYFLLYQPA